MNDINLKNIKVRFAEHIANSALEIIPDESIVCEIFRKIWPTIFSLRKQGFSFTQITKLLDDSGFSFSQSDIEIMHGEMLYEKIESFGSSSPGQ